MAKQTRADRERRLDQGCCPVHGVGMPQVGQWYYVVESGPPLGVVMSMDEILDAMKLRSAYTIVECPRQDCDIQAKASSPQGPAELLPEWAYLLEEAPATAPTD